MSNTPPSWTSKLKTWWPALLLLPADRALCWVGFVLPLNFVIAAEVLLFYIGYGFLIGFRAANTRAALPYVGCAVVVRLIGAHFQANSIWQPQAGDAAFLYGFAWALPVSVAALLALGIPAARGKRAPAPTTDQTG
jgi:hypothetical protein